MNDLRKHKRVTVELTCHLQCEGDPAPIPTTVMNVSYGGMAVIAPKELPLGTIVEIQHRDFPCVTTDTTASKCRVVSVVPAKGRMTGFRLGLTFETYDKAFIERLLQWTQMQSLVQKKFQQRIAANRPRWG